MGKRHRRRRRILRLDPFSREASANATSNRLPGRSRQDRGRDRLDGARVIAKPPNASDIEPRALSDNTRIPLRVAPYGSQSGDVLPILQHVYSRHALCGSGDGRRRRHADDIHPKIRRRGPAGVYFPGAEGTIRHNLPRLWQSRRSACGRVGTPTYDRRHAAINAGEVPRL
jgi:hypothetical protein